jgi:hypothetical protein
MTLRLNQLLGIEKQVKDAAANALTGAYHDAQKSALVDGFSRTYQPAEEGGEQFAPEEKVLQIRIRDQVRDSFAKLAELIDLTARKDAANCSAKASVEVDGVVLLADVPATHLLWLKKKLEDLRTFASKLPRLPADEQWTWSEAQNCYVSGASVTGKTRKLNVPIVMVPATKEHPAQVAMATEDKTIGHWTATKYSGALPATTIAGYLDRIDKLLIAVKQAQQKANSVEVPTVEPIGQKVLGFILG